MAQPNFNGVTVSTVATRLTTGDPAIAITIWNNDPAADLYIGTDPTVTTATGFPIRPKTAFTFDFGMVAAPAHYYGIVAAATLDARWIGRT